MNRSSGRPDRGQKRPIYRARGKIGAIIVAALVGLYTLLAPAISKQIGFDLPTLTADSDGGVRVGGEPAKQTESRQTEGAAATSATAASEAEPSKAPASSSTTAPPSATAPVSATSNSATSNKADSDTATSETAASDLLYGRLKEISRDRYLSISGLLYTPGSAEGHRLEHLRRHTEDQPGRPGKHGVFDGDMAGAIKTVDLAYERAQKGQRTTTSTEQGRTVYTVDMGKRVGYIGGRDGNRKRKPMARRVRLVVEGNRLITAFPL